MAGSVFVFQQDFSGPGYHSSLKFVNPSITDGTGSASFSTLYNMTRNLAVGTEVLAQRAPFQSAGKSYATELGFQAAARYTGLDWTALLQVAPSAATTFGYIQRLTDCIDAGAELAVVPSALPRGRQAVATVGVKYEYRPATFRGQIDSTGKVAAYLEHRINPIMSFLLSGEIDHAKVRSVLSFGATFDRLLVAELLEVWRGLPAGHGQHRRAYVALIFCARVH
jgi:mitochondrial import receptor subunit TOM40